MSGTPTCDRVHMAHTCAREISHACRMTTPPGGACGAVGGYGHVEFSGDSMDVICMQNLVRITGVQPAALQATGVFCDANDANFSGCRAAINRYCASMGHASGFGFPDSFEGTFTVNCIPTSVGAAFNRPWSALAAINPGCAGPNPHNIYCPHAVHHWCRANGFASGWGTVEHNASNVVFVCVRNL